MSISHKTGSISTGSKQSEKEFIYALDIIGACEWLEKHPDSHQGQLAANWLKAHYFTSNHKIASILHKIFIGLKWLAAITVATVVTSLIAKFIEKLF